MNIYIDPADELNTIVHRMRLAKETNLVLILPDSCEALRNRINLQLLANYSKEWEKKIALQTDDPGIISLAEEFGITVLSSPADKESVAAKDEGKQATASKARAKSKRRTHRIRDRLAVLLLIVAAILGILYLNTPQARVVVSPAHHQFNERIMFAFSQLDTALSLQNTSVNVTRRTPATGIETVGISASQGVVVLLNQNNQDVSVPAGTIVSTGNQISFKTISEVTVPAVTTEYFMDVPTGLKAGRAEVPVAAVAVGQRGNVSAGRIVAIPGFDLEVRNPEATYGGQETVLTTVTAEDIARVKASVEREARQLVLEGLQQNINDGFLLKDTIELDIIWEDVSEVGSEAEEVFVTGIVEAHCYQAHPEELTDTVLEVMAAITPEGFMVEPDSIELSSWEVISGEEQQLALEISGAFKGIVDPASLTQQLLGISVEEANRLGDRLSHISQVIVERNRGDRLPRLSRWVEVLISDE